MGPHVNLQEMYARGATLAPWPTFRYTTWQTRGSICSSLQLFLMKLRTVFTKSSGAVYQTFCVDEEIGKA